MQITASNLTISPPQAGELCERCCATAMVAVLIVPEGCKNPLSFMFCGHHFDVHQRSDKPFKVFNDTRKG